MGLLHSTAASLRFFGDDLEPGELTRLLGRQPTSANRKGDRRRSQSTGKEYAPYRTGGWRLAASDREPGDLDDQVVEIVSGLTDDLAVWAQLSKYQPNLFCGLFLRSGNEGLTLTATTLTILADRGIELQLDVYGPSKDEAAADQA